MTKPKPPDQPKPPLSEYLTSEEIEALRRDKRELSEFYRDAFADLRPKPDSDKN